MKVKGSIFGNNLRWVIVTMVAIATIINYIDRGTIGYLWPEISKDLNFTKSDYATISIVFTFSYAFGQALFGRIFDWIGTRLGFVLSIGVWSAATALHAVANSVLSFSIFRGILGVSEAGNWPGATKANATWFPIRERALAQGIFNSGAAIGGIISPLLIGFLSVYFSWKAIFIIVGLMGAVWLIPWVILYKARPKLHPWISDEERDYILSGQLPAKKDFKPKADADEYNPKMMEMLKRKESWGAILSAAFIDPIWWLFVFWIPIYLSETFGFNVKEIAVYAWVPYVGAMFGAWFGGLLAGNRIKAGWTVNKTRKSVIFLGCAIMLPALLLMGVSSTPLMAVLLMALILFGFQTAIGNIQTLPSDLFGGKSVGSLAGFAGMTAKLSVVALTYFVPFITKTSYVPAFIIGAGLAILTLLSVLSLCGDIKPLKPRP